MAKENFVHLSRTFLETPKLDQLLKRFPHEKHVKVVGDVDVLTSEERQKNGIIFLSAHIGNWELAAPVCADRLGDQVSGVYRPQQHPYLEKILLRCRDYENTTLIPHRGATRKLLRALKRREGVALIADQRAKHGEGVDTMLFGKATRSFAAPVKLHLRTGAPLCVGLILREPGLFEFTARVRAVTAPRSGDEETDVQRLAQAYTSVFEEAIRDYPTQWLWAHRRWDGVSRKRERHRKHR